MTPEERKAKINRQRKKAEEILSRKIEEENHRVAWENGYRDRVKQYHAYWKLMDQWETDTKPITEKKSGAVTRFLRKIIGRIKFLRKQK